MLSVVSKSSVMPCAFIIIVTTLSIVMLGVKMPRVVMLIVVMLDVNVARVLMLGVIMLSVVVS
jgi:hypothetical protein